MRHWTVHLTYLDPDEKWRRNAKVGVLAATLEQAAAVTRECVPTEWRDVTLYAIQHQGKIDYVGPIEGELLERIRNA